MTEAEVTLLSCVVDLVGGWCQAVDIILVNCLPKAADVQSMSGVEMMVNRAVGN